MRKSIKHPVSVAARLCIAIAALSTVTLCKPTAAYAQERSMRVSLADLDLLQVDGMQAARERLHQTARKLCLRTVNPWALSHQADYVNCVDATTAKAVQQLNGLALVASAKRHTPSHSLQ